MEFKQIKDLPTTSDPIKTVVLDNNNELKLADYAGGGGQDGLMVDIEVNKTLTSILSITPSFDNIAQSIEDGEKVTARIHYEYTEDDEIENECFYTNSVIYKKNINESKGDNSRKIFIEFNTTTKDEKVSYSYIVNMISKDGALTITTISKVRNIPLNDVDAGSLLQYYEREDGQAYWIDTPINTILGTPSTAGEVLTSTASGGIEWKSATAAPSTIYLDVTPSSDFTSFEVLKDSEPIGATEIIQLVNEGYNIIAKARDNSNIFTIFSLTNFWSEESADGQVDNAIFSMVADLGSGYGVFRAQLTSDHSPKNVGTLEFIPF